MVREKDNDTGNKDEQIETLREEVAQLREELALLPERLIERMRQEFKVVNTQPAKRHNPAIPVVTDLNIAIETDSFIDLQQAHTLFDRSINHIRQIVREHTLSHEYDKGHIVIRPSVLREYFDQARVGRPRREK